MKASLLALSDPDLKDSNILHTIYALAIKHRLDPSSMDDVTEPEPVEKAPPKKVKRSTEKTAGKAATAP